jgi:hypothetical protein
VDALDGAAGRSRELIEVEADELIGASHGRQPPPPIGGGSFA